MKVNLNYTAKNARSEISLLKCGGRERIQCNFNFTLYHLLCPWFLFYLKGSNLCDWGATVSSLSISSHTKPSSLSFHYIHNQRKEKNVDEIHPKHA